MIWKMKRIKLLEMRNWVKRDLNFKMNKFNKVNNKYKINLDKNMKIRKSR